jgi:hypothetical protein
MQKGRECTFINLSRNRTDRLFRELRAARLIPSAVCGIDVHDLASRPYPKPGGTFRDPGYLHALLSLNRATRVLTDRALGDHPIAQNLAVLESSKYREQ